MYAVINTGGKQAKVEKGTVLAVERLSAGVGDTVSLPVLFVADGESVYATPSEIAGASVTAEVLEHFKGEKQIVFKFKKRKGYKRTKGHRQTLTSVRVLEIALGTAPAKAEKKADEPKAAKPKAEKKAEEPKAAKPKAEQKTEEPTPVVAPVEAPEAPAAAPAESGLCAAVKADGTQCANKAKEGSKYCGVHAKYEG